MNRQSTKIEHLNVKKFIPHNTKVSARFDIKNKVNQQSRTIQRLNVKEFISIYMKNKVK